MPIFGSKVPEVALKAQRISRQPKSLPLMSKKCSLTLVIKFARIVTRSVISSRGHYLAFGWDMGTWHSCHLALHLARMPGHLDAEHWNELGLFVCE